MRFWPVSAAGAEGATAIRTDGLRIEQLVRRFGVEQLGPGQFAGRLRSAPRARTAPGCGACRAAPRCRRSASRSGASRIRPLPRPCRDARPACRCGRAMTAHLSPLLRDPGKKWAERDRCSRFPFVSVQRDARIDVPADQHDLLAGGKHRLPRRAAIIVGVDDQSGALGTSGRQQLRAGSSRIVLIEDGDVSVTTCERPNQPPVSAP